MARWGGWGARLVAVAALAALVPQTLPDAGDRVPRMPEIAAPPPIPAAYRAPLRGPFRVQLGDVRMVTRLGAEIEVARVEGVYEFPALAGSGAPVVHARTVRVHRPRITLPIDTLVTGFDPFIELLDRPVVVDRLVVEHGVLRERADPRQFPWTWLWRFEELELDARDLHIGGAAEGLRVARFAGTGEVRGRPLRIEQLALGAVRVPARVDFHADLDLGVSRVRAEGAAQRSGPWTIALTADTAHFAEVRALLRRLPAEGGASASGRLSGRGGAITLVVDRLSAGVRESRFLGRGRVALGPETVVDDVVLVLPRVRPTDLAAWGVELPDSAVWSGRLRAEDARRGIRLDGEFVRAEGSAGESRLALAGSVQMKPELTLDLRLDADPLRVADTALHVALRAQGGAEDLRVNGRVALAAGPAAGPVAAERVGWGTAAAEALAPGAQPAPRPARPAVAATVAGRLGLRGTAPLDLRLTADSLPLSALPLPRALHGSEGLLAGEVVVGGTVERPALSGTLRVDNGAFRLAGAGTRIEEITGAVQLDAGGVRVERLTARVGGGRVSVAGRAWRAAGSDTRLDFVVRADSARVLDTEDAQLAASTDLQITGSMREPRVAGRVALVGGWAKEDLFRPTGPLDPSDPPYADLAARVPWPADSRLRRARPPAPGVAARAHARVRVHVTPGLRVIDEDSEIRGVGQLNVALDTAVAQVRGTVRVLRGFYAFFGERFRVQGGAFRFDGRELEPRVAVVATHQGGGRPGGELGDGGAQDRFFSSLEFQGRGRASRPREEVRRPALLPETREQLTALLMFGLEPQPVTGWRQEAFFRPNANGELVGERAEAQSVPLFWSYIADEAYDYLPLSRGYLRAGTIAVGSRYPGRVVVGPVFGGGVMLGRNAEMLLAQPLDGGAAPGVRARIGVRDTWLELFNEPRFQAAAAAGRGHPGFTLQRRVGITIRWEREF